MNSDDKRGNEGPRLHSRALVIVARQPVLGAVKTRLSQALGAETALRFYECFLDDIIGRFAAGPYDFYFAVTPPDGPLNARGWAHFAQEGTSLNERLFNIFRRHHGTYPGGTLIMSSDSPHVPQEWIAQGFDLLESTDAVFGPTDDGGYWIVGMREPHDVFSSVPMSTDSVLRETLALAKAKRLQVKLLPQTFDVDTVNDIESLRMYLISNDQMLPATKRFLMQRGARE